MANSRPRTVTVKAWAVVDASGFMDEAFRSKKAAQSHVVFLTLDEAQDWEPGYTRLGPLHGHPPHRPVRAEERQGEAMSDWTGYSWIER